MMTGFEKLTDDELINAIVLSRSNLGMELVNRIDDLMAVLFETDCNLLQAGDELRLLNDLRNENTALEERIERLEGKLDDAYQDIADLKDRLKEAEDALEDARTM